MKTIFLFVLVLVAVGVTYLAVEGGKLQEVKTEIDISVPPSKIWPIIIDINSWEEWSPVINASSGTASVGSELTITMIGKEEGKDGPTYSPVITKLEEPNYLSWRAHMLAGFIFTNYKILELEETDSGTRLTHKEQFKGLLTPIMRGHMKEGVPPILNAMNKALKDLAEK